MFYSTKDRRYNKGYCHVYFKDEATYELALSQTRHFIGQRQIFCKAFISGRRLSKYNRTNNLKRIIVHNVPACIKESDIHGIFK